MNNGSENILACYGEKTIEDETYGKLLFFIDDEENCFTYNEDANQSIDTVDNTEYAFSEAAHDWRDVRRDIGSFATTKEELQEAVHGLVPASI